MNIKRDIIYVNKDFVLCSQLSEYFLTYLQVDIDFTYGDGGYKFKTLDIPFVINGHYIDMMTFYNHANETIITGLLEKSKNGTLSNIIEFIPREKRVIRNARRFYYYEEKGINGAVVYLFNRTCKILKRTMNVSN